MCDGFLQLRRGDNEGGVIRFQLVGGEVVWDVVFGLAEREDGVDVCVEAQEEGAGRVVAQEVG